MTEQPTDTISRAADLIRTRAAAATRGPWLSMDGGDRLVHDPGHDLDPPEYVVDEPMSSEANAEHIAAWHPLVADAVAAWLDEMADCWDSWTRSREHIGLDPLSADPLQERPAGYDAAWTVARTYLGEQA